MRKGLCEKCYSVLLAARPDQVEKRREYARNRYWDKQKKWDTRLNYRKAGYQQKALWSLWTLLGGYNQYARILEDLQRLTDYSDDQGASCYAGVPVAIKKWGIASRDEWRKLLRKSTREEIACQKS